MKKKSKTATARPEWISLKTLKPNERNPRKISDPAFEKLCRSIRRDPRFMELRPIIVDEENVIMGGNQRYHACRKIGKTKVPKSWVRVAADLTETQRRRFVLLDNSPEGMAGYWDFDVLQADYNVAELEDAGFAFAEDVDFEKEWQGMPEFEQEALDVYKTLAVRFANKEDYESFAKLIGQKLTEQSTTKGIWYPKQDQDQLNREVEYADES